MPDPADNNPSNDDNSKSTPEGFYLEQNVLSEENCKILQTWLEKGDIPGDQGSIKIPWQMGAQNRQVAQFGFRFNYEKSQVESSADGNSCPKVPLALQNLLLGNPQVQTLLQRLQDSSDYTQCIINWYQKDTIIPWHWDHIHFGPVVVVFVLGDDRPLKLRRLKEPFRSTENSNLPASKCHHEEGAYQDDDYDYYEAFPRHGSCYILSGPARYEWEHSVPPGSEIRVSFTFRSKTKDKGYSESQEFKG